MKTFLQSSCLTLLTIVSAAGETQAAQQLSLWQITSGTFSSASPAAVTPLADGESYAQVSSDGTQVVGYSFKTGKATGVLFDAATARGSKVETVEGFIMSPDGKHMLIQTETTPIYRRSKTAVYYLFSLRNNKLEPLSEGGPQQSPVFSPDGNQVAFVRDNNIYLVKLLYDNAESQVTKDGERGKVINGVPDWVYEEEFSTNCSLVFTADSKQIVWVRYDESRVSEYQLQLYQGSHPKRSDYRDYPGLYSYKYPVAGGDNAKVSVMSFDIKSRQTRTMQLPLDADGYVPRLVATSDSSRVAVFTLNRHQDCLRIYMANPLSTNCQMVVEDKVDKYVGENEYTGALLQGRHLLLMSQRSGYRAAYLYNLNGQLLRTVNAPDQQTDVSAIYGYDEQSGDIYFAAQPGAVNQKLYVQHKSGKTDCLTPSDGWSSATFSASMKYLLCNWSNINTPPVYSLMSNTGKTLATLEDNKALATKYATYTMGTKELFTLTTGDGVKLNGWMVKPAGFNPQRRYPVVMYQYGGPGSQEVKNAWGIGMCGQGAILEQLMAQEDFVVVCVDNRGTGGRGADFEKCTYLKLGELEARDQVETALWLAQQSWVDGKRIGIWGWSYGGWNTLMAMSEGRAAFRAGIAIAPPTSWRYYDTVYSERFMRTPNENQHGYDDICPLARASQLSGALLICHGLADDNVHYQNTAEYVEALVQADKDFRQLVYTNRNHGIAGGNTRNHLFRQCMNFFNSELKN